MKRAEHLLGLVAKTMAACGGAILLGVMVLSMVNLSMRWFGVTLDGWVEASGFICAMAVGLCLPAAQMFGVDIEVGVIADRLSSGMRRKLGVAAGVVTVCLLVIVVLRMGDLSAYYLEYEEFIENTELSPLPMVLCLAAGLAVQGLVTALQLYRLVRKENT